MIKKRIDKTKGHTALKRKDQKQRFEDKRKGVLSQ